MEFDILPTYTRTSSQTASDVFGNLYELVKTGTITLTGLSNEQLPVLPQALDGSHPHVEGMNCFNFTASKLFRICMEYHTLEKENLNVKWFSRRRLGNSILGDNHTKQYKVVVIKRGHAKNM